MSKIGKVRTLMGAAFPTALLLALIPATSAAAGTISAGPTPYYLALGDSLSQGVQPNSTGASFETNQGYVNDLYSLYRHEVPGLQLAQLGCPGETTGTMIDGGVCSYALGSQLAQAAAFLETHHFVLVTIDIGANNVDGCLTTSGINVTCIGEGIADAESQLPVIVHTLQIASPGVRIVAMNYYDPFLAEWLQGTSGEAVATASVTLATGFNAVLGDVYGDFSVPVADVQDAFQTTNATTVPILNLPLNVATICALTWMCAPSPVGPNIHANVFGYGLIAVAFEQTIGPL
jgi:lysophospholipase L1-like esterase